MTGERARPAGIWLRTLLLFALASCVETMGVSHVLAFAPLYLPQLGASPVEVPFWTGLISAGGFVVGLPLVPFWGVWADQYGRKLVIARSAYVEAVVLLLVALSRTPLELVGSMLLAGFQLGNTGVMYAALTSITPRDRVGLTLSIVSMASALGLALGPVAGGLLADLVGLKTLYLVDAILSLGSGLAITFLFVEAQPRRPAAGSTWRRAWEAVAGIASARMTRLVFLTYVLILMGRQMMLPFLPLLVQVLHGGETPASVVGLVVGATATAGALVTPAAGALGDRLGHARVLAWAAGGAVLSGVALALAPNLWALSALALLSGAFTSGAVAVCVALLATTTPEERRSSTLNLALLPLYVGGIAGPVLGAGLAAIGLRVVFLGAAAPLAASYAMARRLASGEGAWRASS